MSVQDNRFTKADRMLKAVDYQNVFDQPSRATDKYFTVLGRNNLLNEPRLGLAISKKNARRAVDRNRIKRIVRESFRIHKNKLASMDFVVMAKYSATKADNLALFDSLSALWKILDSKFSMSADS